MGHKVHPVGFRLGVVKGWQSRWFAERDYKDVFAEDLLVRREIQRELANASVSRIEIERAAANQVAVTIHTAKPGIVIGRSGEKVDKLRAALEVRTKKRVRLNIVEIRQPELDAFLVGRSIAEQLEKRVSFRRAMKQAVQKSMRANAKGVKVIVGGRLGGAEIARSEKEVEGKVPLHTLRADIDYGQTEAHTTFGVIGIKVWIYKGDILPRKRREPGELPEVAPQPTFTPRERDGGDRRGERAPRRGSGDRDRGADRGPRPQGDRPQGERAPRPPRASADRGPRPQGDQPQGERAPRPPRASADRGPRPQGDQPQGERAPRPPRAERPPRSEQPQQARPAPAPAAPETTATPDLPVVTPVAPIVAPDLPTPEPTTTPDLPTSTPTPEAGTGGSESE